jgi:hypothetical protein
MIRTLLVAAAVLCALASNASARHHRSGLHPECNVTMPCEVPAFLLPALRSPVFAQAPRSRQTSATIVAHPEGCPARLFCGCGAAVRIFGRPIRDLWLAANWFRFPRGAPAPGMVAVRRHHVFVLEAHLGGDTWQVYDANSGGRKTRIHARSITGYSIVNPRA